MVTRTPNRRGEGARLRDEIVAAASRLLERSGNEEALTLRGVAREAGIAAPSIYGHFGDREAILDAVIAGAFAELEHATRAAAQDARAGRERVTAVCRAYVSFARDNPARYRVLFERSRAATTAVTPRPGIDDLQGAAAFGVLLDAVAVLTEQRSEALTTAMALWVALHGYATLRASVPAFPWPEGDALLQTLLDRLT